MFCVWHVGIENGCMRWSRQRRPKGPGAPGMHRGEGGGLYLFGRCKKMSQSNSK